MAAISKKTPFYPWHAEHGAALYEKGGWTRPARYEDAASEHTRVRAAGGIMDVHSMGKVLIEGPGACGLLDYVATNDIAGVKVGGARYTCLCAEDGGIADDVIIYRTGDERFLLVTNTLSRERVLGLLREQAAGRNAFVADVTSAVAYIAVQGPQCRAVLAAAEVQADLSGQALGYFETAEARLGPARILLARTGYTGELGYELYFPPSTHSTCGSACVRRASR